jgi:hypothetical protein
MKKPFTPSNKFRASLYLFSFVFLLASCLPVQPTEPVKSGNSGEVLYQENFADNTSGWDRVLNDGGIMDYDSGGYRILVRQPGLNFWSTPEKNFGDMRVEADVTKLNGPDENRAGLMCRYRNGDYYFFIISNDGFYAIGKFIGAQTLLLGQKEMQASDLILPNSTNHLRADCIGNTLTFYINFNQVASVQDGDFSTGDVGVLAGAFNQPGVDVLFQNFVVIQP